MPEATPAPASTTTSAPSAPIFFTVSGVAPTRRSVLSLSAGTPTFMLPPGSPLLLTLDAPFQRFDGRGAREAGNDARSSKENGHQDEDDHDYRQTPPHQLD